MTFFKSIQQKYIFFVCVLISPIQNSPVYDSPQNHSIAQKNSLTQKNFKKSPKKVEKTVPLIEVIIVSETEKKTSFVLNTFLFQLIRIIKGILVGKLEHSR